MPRNKRTYSRRAALAVMAGLSGVAGRLAWGAPAGYRQGTLRAGAYAIDTTPQKLPVTVIGSLQGQIGSTVLEPLHARCLVLDDGRSRIAIAVADVLFFPQEMLDAVKKEVRKSTGIAEDRVLISATHTHTAPSVFGGLGSGADEADEAYAAFLPAQLVKGIEKAVANLEPARVGYAVAKDYEHTHCRRWILRSDRIRSDPFGEKTVRANMHPGFQNPDFIDPSGPVDPDIMMLSVQARNGRPLALLANYSMHYYSTQAVSPDYYGPFCTAFARLIGAEQGTPPFVAMMSQGTSGDQHWMDYSRPAHSWGDRVKYAELVAQAAVEAYEGIEYRDDATIQMAERTLKFRRRAPDEKRLAWARATLASKTKDALEANAEVYAREAIRLHRAPTSELKLQAIRIGDLGITAIPNEVYAISGLKLKARSPLQTTMNIELANGAYGYIPPPEQHVLGGYTTWPAGWGGLEVGAEPKIVETALELLEEVSGRPAREIVDPEGPYVEIVRKSNPAALWRLSEIEGTRAVDTSGREHHGRYEDGVAFYLPGPEGTGFRGEKQANRAAHFAGGRMCASIPEFGDTYSIEMWLWNGMPFDARPVTGYVFSRGPDGNESCPGDHLGIGGTIGARQKLFFFNGNGRGEALTGITDIGLRTWHHVVLARDGKRVLVYLNGNRTPEIASEADVTRPADTPHVFVGGRCDNFANWEGKIAEVAVYNRALTPDEVIQHYIASGTKA